MDSCGVSLQAKYKHASWARTSDLHLCYPILPLTYFGYVPPCYPNSLRYPKAAGYQGRWRGFPRAHGEFPVLGRAGTEQCFGLASWKQSSRCWLRGFWGHTPKYPKVIIPKSQELKWGKSCTMSKSIGPRSWGGFICPSNHPLICLFAHLPSSTCLILFVSPPIHPYLVKPAWKIYAKPLPPM